MSALRRQERSFVHRTLCDVDLRDEPVFVGLTFRKIERSKFSSLPIGRIAERITQAIGEGPQLSRRPPTLRVGHINEFLLRLHSNVDHLQAASLYVGARNNIGRSAMPSPASAASRIMSPLFTSSAARPRTIVAPFDPEKRQSPAPRFV